MIGIALAAGSGYRLSPITAGRPKAALPTPRGPLVHWALARLSVACRSTYVTASGASDELSSAVAGMSAVVHEGSRPVGTALGLANALKVARDAGLDGDVAFTSADTIYLGDLRDFYEGWEGREPRLLVVSDFGHVDFGPCWRFTGTALLPRDLVAGRAPRSADVVDDLLAPAVQSGSAELYVGDGAFFDCGTPVEYWLAMMHLTSGEGLVEPGAQILGRVDRCVVLRNAMVRADQCVSDAVVHGGGSIPVGVPGSGVTVWGHLPTSACRMDDSLDVEDRTLCE
jgi:N-acetyl-alpha-D-muramate 1-phosphate uridylyltransferase